MPSSKTPTPEQVAQAIELLARPEHYRYFFDRLNNPEWLEPLREHGFFDMAPEPIDAGEGRLRFPIWPATRYLARMAALAPETATDIAASIDTDNTSVQEDIADVALALPAAYAAKLVPKLSQWVRSPFHWGLPSKLATLAVQLAKQGFGPEALDIASAIIRLERPGSDGDTSQEGREPVPTYQHWEYDTVMGTLVPALGEVLGDEAVHVFAETLEAALDIWRGTDAPPYDYSYIWRSAIEDHGQNLPIGPRYALVSGVRDTAEAAVRARPGDLKRIVESFEQRRWFIFRRLALHLLRLFPDEAHEAIAARLADHDLFDAVQVRHEYTLLLREHFGLLGETERQQILGFVEEIGTTEGSTRLPAEEEEAARKRWQLERLEPISEDLPIEWRERYDELVEQFGRPEHPEFLAYSRGTWVGPTSPKTIAELEAMSVDEVVAYLRTWEPSRRPMADSPEGLARALGSIVESGRLDLVVEAARFKEMDPTYVRALLGGIRALAVKGTTFNWTPIIDLCMWIVKQPREIPDRQSEYADLDPGWVWTRKEIAGLLSAGLDSGAAEIPKGLRQEVWSLLEILLGDPQPGPGDESVGTDFEPLTQSINTVRGEALHALLRYGLWVRRYLEEEGQGELSFDQMPEVRKALDQHLDREQDPSLAIRAVYGQWFPWLSLLDRQWSEKAVPRIFERSDDAFWHAAWDTYVVYCQAYDDVFPLLASEYEHAIQQLGAAEKPVRRLEDPDRQLGEHLGVLYWRGLISYGEPGDDSLLDLFFERADSSQRADLMEFVGRAAAETPTLEPEVADRLKRLWERRASVAMADIEEHKRELMRFGWWFSAEGLDLEWRLQQLLSVLEGVGRVEPEYEVVEKLVPLAADHSRSVAQATLLLVRADPGSWWVHGSMDEVRAILDATVESEDEQARALARDAVDELGRRGFLNFRDLLRS
jgi:hypothetical protein